MLSYFVPEPDIGVEENRHRDDTHQGRRTEAERRRAEEPLGRMDSVGGGGTFEDGTGYDRASVRRNVGLARTAWTRGTPPGPNLVQNGPGLNVVARRFLFHTHDRRPGQSVAQFAEELKHLSVHCGFGSGLDDALRDRLVCGLEEEATQRRLLEEEAPLSFSRALAIALDMEAGQGKERPHEHGQRPVSGHRQRPVAVSGHGPRAVAVLHVVRDVDSLLVVKDKVPHELSWSPTPPPKAPAPPPVIKEEKEGPMASEEGGRVQCLMQHIPVLDSLADLTQLVAVTDHAPSQQDATPSLDQDLDVDQDQDCPNPPGTKEELETLYVVKEGEQHQDPILVLECPADMQHLWANKEDPPPEQMVPRPSLVRVPEGPGPGLDRVPEGPGTSGGLKETHVDCEEPELSDLEDCAGLDPLVLEDSGGSDSPDLLDCGGPEPDPNPDHIRVLRRRPAPDSGPGLCEPKQTDASTDREPKNHRPPPGPPLGKDMCPTLTIRMWTPDMWAGRPHCPVCQKDFQYQSWLKKHMRIHSREPPPPDPPHMTTPPPDKPVAQSGDSKSLSPKIYLKKYQINVTGEGTFVCSVCDKIFVSRRKLIDHREGHRGHREGHREGRREGHRGLREGLREGHREGHRGHREVKPFSCPECGRGFCLKSSVKRHMKSHALEKPYNHPKCGKTPQTKAVLLVHTTNHVGKTPHGCSNCGQRFSKLYSLKRHMMLH